MAIRLGTSATIIDNFAPEKITFGTPPDSPIHLSPLSASSLHGNLHWAHLNSILSARSFFQVGPVKPVGERLWRFGHNEPLGKAALTLSGSQRRIRGNVNGNVLVPRTSARRSRPIPCCA
ncbi:MAG: hypothetical protein R2724_11380 [Bryobacterales bacterium]